MSLLLLVKSQGEGEPPPGGGGDAEANDDNYVKPKAMWRPIRLIFRGKS